MKILIVAFISLTLFGSCAHHSKSDGGCHEKKAACADCASADKKMKTGGCKECDEAGVSK